MSTSKVKLDNASSDTFYVKQETTFSTEPPPAPKGGLGGCLTIFALFWLILGSCWIYSEMAATTALAW